MDSPPPVPPLALSFAFLAGALFCTACLGAMIDQKWSNGMTLKVGAAPNLAVGQAHAITRLPWQTQPVPIQYPGVASGLRASNGQGYGMGPHPDSAQHDAADDLSKGLSGCLLLLGLGIAGWSVHQFRKFRRAPESLAMLTFAGQRQGTIALHAAASTSPTTDEFSSFMSWAAEKNLLKGDTLQLSKDAQGPLLKLRRDVAAGEVLCEIPSSLWLTADRARREFNAPTGEPEWLTIAHALLDAKRGEAPALGPYVSTIPNIEAAPAVSVLLWPPELQNGLLAGTQLLSSLQGYLAYLAAEGERLGSMKPDDLLWGFAAVRSRRRPPLSEGSDLALVPMLDLVRHAPVGQALASVTRAGLFGPNRPIRIEAARPARAGEIVTCDFAPEEQLGEGTLLLDYAQACVAYPQHTYTLQLEVPEDAIFRDDKLDILEINGLSPNPTFTIVAGEAPPDDLLAILRLLSIKNTDAFLLEAIFRKQVWDFCQQPISQDNERELCESMLNNAKAALQALPPSGSFVWTKLDTREAVAAYACSSEAKVLQWCVDWFGTRLQELRKLEYYQERRLKDLGLLDEQGESTYSEGDVSNFDY